ncbi:MAG: hypothetical protein OEW31_04275 [Thermoleophilia bacterium]|nr:hypothetical protein [Thermoleophilia bacterium]MDH4345534.1 hypothetical protein [Thermoleophilia bacterium]
MRWLRFGALVVVAGALALFGAACGGAGSNASSEITADDFDPANFDDPTRIDNTWFPLAPGTKHVYEGTALEDDERIAHRVEFVVTDLTKVVGGIRSRVIWERDYVEDELVEAELALFAQDNDGNVWHLGQYPEEYEQGEIVAAPAWFHGLEGAKAGIAMKVEPHLGTAAYSQGFAPPPINWVDHAEVHEMGIENCTPVDCFQDVLVTREFEPDKPDASQLKYYAPGVGNIRVGWFGDKDENKEVLELVELVELDSDGLAEARAGAMELEASAYTVSKDVYGKTPPAGALEG